MIDLPSDAIQSAAFQKLKITAFEEDDLKTPIGSPFEAYYNPASFSSSYSISYNEEVKTIGETKYPMKFHAQNPITFSFKLRLDGTGASKPYGIPSTEGKLNVDKKIDEFLSTIYNYTGTIHRPNYLQIVWGKTLVANVVLATLSISKDLFSPSGETLRADLDCSFKEFSNQELSNANKKTSSPDMTHIRVVQQGDRLPLMCERIYGDATLYLQVAKHNNLVNYRKLTPGQQIHFPPLVPNKS